MRPWGHLSGSTGQQSKVCPWVAGQMGKDLKGKGLHRRAALGRFQLSRLSAGRRQGLAGQGEAFLMPVTGCAAVRKLPASWDLWLPQSQPSVPDTVVCLFYDNYYWNTYTLYQSCAKKAHG